MADEPVRKPEDAETEEGIALRSARNALGDLVIRAGVRDERIVITRNGKQAAALIGMRDLERLRALDEAEATAVAVA
jgi:prevent-host-death family protein